MPGTVVTYEEAISYLGITFEDDNIKKSVNRMIAAADCYLCGSVGSDYPKEDPRAKEIALMVISDLWENRGVSQTVSANTRKLLNDMSLQLKLELRRGAGK